MQSLKPDYLVPMPIRPTYSNSLSVKMGIITVYTSQGFIRLKGVNMCISDLFYIQHLSQGNWKGATETIKGVFISKNYALNQWFSKYGLRANSITWKRVRNANLLNQKL